MNDGSRPAAADHGEAPTIPAVREGLPSFPYGQIHHWLGEDGLWACAKQACALYRLPER